MDSAKSADSGFLGFDGWSLVEERRMEATAWFTG